MQELIKQKNIENLIYEIRGKQAMLDSDLAKLYKCKNGTKTINQAVKRHMKRFPERFMFRLDKIEYINLKSQTGTSSWNKYGGTRKLPYAFTEQGVAMLSAVLKTEIAEEVSVRIMDAFVMMKKYISTNLIEQKYYNDMTIRHDSEIKVLQESFNKFEEKRKVNETYYNGQIYDAYSKIMDIFNTSKKELIIIDAYADKSVLDMISKLKVSVILIVKEKGLLSINDIEKYNKQYNNLKIIYSTDYHDRYFIIDKKEVYHCGASINHAGSRTFSINKWNDEEVIRGFISRVLQIINK